MVPEINDTKADDWVSIARITRTWGLRGEVIAEILTDFPERFADLEKVTLLRDAEALGSFELAESWFHKGRIILKFVGYDDVTQAEKLRGASLVIARHDLVDLETDEYYLFDLEGCEVFTVSGQSLGSVIRVNDYGAAPILVIKNDQQEFLIPLAREICPEVDTAMKKIIVDPPDGLLDL